MEGIKYRTFIIKSITFLAGLYFLLEFLLPETTLSTIGFNRDVHQKVTEGCIAAVSMSFGLGLINIFMTHGKKIIFRTKGFFYSIVLTTALITMLIVSTLDWIGSEKVSNTMAKAEMLSNYSEHISEQITGELDTKTLEQLKSPKERITILKEEIDKFTDSILKNSREDKNKKEELIELERAVKVVKNNINTINPPNFDTSELTDLSKNLKILGVSYGQFGRVNQLNSFSGKFYEFLFNGIFNSLGAAMFSLLSVYIAVAAFRAFRIKSLESSLMMLAAVIVILGQTPFGVYISSMLPFLRQWLMEVPSSAAFRAIQIGSAVAGLVMAFRMWLSIESESFSNDSTNDS